MTESLSQRRARQAKQYRAALKKKFSPSQAKISVSKKRSSPKKRESFTIIRKSSGDIETRKGEKVQITPKSTVEQIRRLQPRKAVTKTITQNTGLRSMLVPRSRTEQFKREQYAKGRAKAAQIKALQQQGYSFYTAQRIVREGAGGDPAIRSAVVNLKKAGVAPNQIVNIIRGVQRNPSLTTNQLNNISKQLKDIKRDFPKTKTKELYSYVFGGFRPKEIQKLNILERFKQAKQLSAEKISDFLREKRLAFEKKRAQQTPQERGITGKIPKNTKDFNKKIDKFFNNKYVNRFLKILGPRKSVKGGIKDFSKFSNELGGKGATIIAPLIDLARGNPVPLANVGENMFQILPRTMETMVNIRYSLMKKDSKNLIRELKKMPGEIANTVFSRDNVQNTLLVMALNPTLAGKIGKTNPVRAVRKGVQHIDKKYYMTYDPKTSTYRYTNGKGVTTKYRAATQAAKRWAARAFNRIYKKVKPIKQRPQTFNFNKMPKKVQSLYDKAAAAAKKGNMVKSKKYINQLEEQLKIEVDFKTKGAFTKTVNAIKKRIKKIETTPKKGVIGPKKPKGQRARQKDIIAAEKGQVAKDLKKAAEYYNKGVLRFARKYLKSAKEWLSGPLKNVKGTKKYSKMAKTIDKKIRSKQKRELKEIGKYKPKPVKPKVKQPKPKKKTGGRVSPKKSKKLKKRDIEANAKEQIQKDLKKAAEWFEKGVLRFAEKYVKRAKNRIRELRNVKGIKKLNKLAKTFDKKIKSTRKRQLREIGKYKPDVRQRQTVGKKLPRKAKGRVSPKQKKAEKFKIDQAERGFITKQIKKIKQLMKKKAYTPAKRLLDSVSERLSASKDSYSLKNYARVSKELISIRKKIATALSKITKKTLKYKPKPVKPRPGRREQKIPQVRIKPKRLKPDFTKPKKPSKKLQRRQQRKKIIKKEKEKATGPLVTVRKAKSKMSFLESTYNKPRGSYTVVVQQGGVATTPTRIIDPLRPFTVLLITSRPLNSLQRAAFKNRVIKIIRPLDVKKVRFIVLDDILRKKLQMSLPKESQKRISLPKIVNNVKQTIKQEQKKDTKRATKRKITQKQKQKPVQKQLTKLKQKIKRRLKPRKKTIRKAKKKQVPKKKPKIPKLELPKRRAKPKVAPKKKKKKKKSRKYTPTLRGVSKKATKKTRRKKVFIGTETRGRK